jgi:hypothetical protein
LPFAVSEEKKFTLIRDDCFLNIHFSGALTMRRYRSSNTIPFLGTFFSLVGFFCGAAGLVLIIVTFWKGLDALKKLIDGLSYQWGPSIYIIGIGTGCLLISLICFVISLFSRPSDDYDRETLQLGNRDSQFENNNTDAKFHAFSTPPPERGSYYQPYQTQAPYTPQHTHNQQYGYGQNNYSNNNANYSSNYY